METQKAYCNNCCGIRNHEILHKEETSWDEEVDEQVYIEGGNLYEMIKCCGCENVALLHRSWFSEDTDDNDRRIVHTNQYPPTTFRKEPRWLSELVWVLPINNGVGDK